MSNFFSSEMFADAAAGAFFPGKRWSIRAVAADGWSFDALEVRGRVRAGLPFLDFLEPRAQGAFETRKVAHLPRVSTRSFALAAWPAAGFDDAAAAPFIDWKQFGTWAAFVDMAFARDGRAFDKGRKARKLWSARGEPAFELHSKNTALLDLCLTWKSRQYVDSGYPDLFARPEVRQLFRRLQEAGSLLVSVLYAGATPAAIHLGVVHGERFYYWVPAFDRQLESASPGALLLERLMHASYDLGHQAFELLLGDEPYKLNYATHVREVTHAGQPPLLKRAWAPLRERVMGHVRGDNPLYRALQGAKRHVIERGLM